MAAHSQRFVLALAGVACMAAVPAAGHAASVYLNDQNITVALGPAMPVNPFANRGTAESLASIIDAPSASAFEKHNQSTHVWVSGGPLALRFDLGDEYNLSTFHFWNYHTEGFDVDNIDLTFFDAANQLVGSLLGVAPALGGSSPSDATEIFAENAVLNFPAKVRFVDAVLTGSNGQVDFNNIGFTGILTSSVPTTGQVPEPASALLLACGLAALARGRGKR